MAEPRDSFCSVDSLWYGFKCSNSPTNIFWRSGTSCMPFYLKSLLSVFEIFTYLASVRSHHSCTPACKWFCFEQKDKKHSTSGHSTGWWLIHFLGLWAQCHSSCGENKLNSLPHGWWTLYLLDHYTKNERPPSLSRPHLNLWPFQGLKPELKYLFTPTQISEKPYAYDRHQSFQKRLFWITGGWLESNNQNIFRHMSYGYLMTYVKSYKMNSDVYRLTLF